MNSIKIVPDDDPNAPRAQVEIIAQDNHSKGIRVILKVTTDNSRNVHLAGTLAMSKQGYSPLKGLTTLIVNENVYYIHGEFYAVK